MSIARRNFLKSATMTTLSAGLALGSAHLIFGQRDKSGESLPDRRMRPVGREDPYGNFPVPIEAQQDSLFYLRSSTFTPYIGDIFQAPNALGRMVELELTQVSDYRVKGTTRITTKKSRPSRAFSLTFVASEPLPQFTSIHQISHPALGRLDLFLTRYLREDGSYLYEAVFNHIQ